MLKNQKGYTMRILTHINELTIKVEDKKALYRQFVYQLHSLSVAYRQFGGTITNEELLDKFKQKCRSLLDQHPHLHDDIGLYTLFKGVEFNTWDKHLTFHETRSQDSAIESSSRSYDAYLTELGIFGTTKPAVANASVSMTSASDINESNIGGSKKCLVHPNGEHTNDACYKQKDIRATKDVSPYVLISAITKLCQDIASQKQQTKALKRQGQDLHKQKTGSKNT
jgi:hypothetical protein